MIKGFFLPDAPDVPVFPLFVSWGESVISGYFILDTGSTGDLKVSPETAVELGLEPLSVGKITIANGQTVKVPVALAYALMEGVRNPVSVVIEDGAQLAGIGLLTKFGYTAVVDCKNRTVELTKTL
ncbi:MAG: hypothetical protein Q7S26_02040 [bacterium]|nr:hypothetical protein [bacterium]